MRRHLIAMLDDLRARGMTFGRKPKMTPQQTDHARPPFARSPSGPGAKGYLFLRLVTFKNPLGILYLRCASPRTIVCIPRARTVRGVCLSLGRSDVE